MAILASIGALIPGLLGKEVSYKVARLIGFLILGIAVVALLSLGKCAYDGSLIRDHEEQREAAASAARETAADARVEDAITNTKNEEQLHDAIESAPGGTLSPAAHALACERLRRYGRVPPACRPASGD